jgi:hypothetical protein
MVDPSDTASTHETLVFWMYRRSRPGIFRPAPHLLSIFPPCLPFYCLFNLRTLGRHGSPSLPPPTQHEQGSAEAVKSCICHLSNLLKSANSITDPRRVCNFSHWPGHQVAFAGGKVAIAARFYHQLCCTCPRVVTQARSANERVRLSHE